MQKVTKNTVSTVSIVKHVNSEYIHSFTLELNEKSKKYICIESGSILLAFYIRQAWMNFLYHTISLHFDQKIKNTLRNKKIIIFKLFPWQTFRFIALLTHKFFIASDKWHTIARDRETHKLLICLTISFLCK